MNVLPLSLNLLLGIRFLVQIMVTVCCQSPLDDREAIVCLLEMMGICSDTRYRGAYNTCFGMGASRMNTVTMSTGIILKKIRL